MMITSKFKYIILRLVSCILFMAIAMQVVIMPVSASDDIPYECTSKVTLPSYQKKDWKEAKDIIEEQGETMYQGYFHEQVQKHIVDKYKVKGYLIEMEFKIIYKPEQKKEEKKWARRYSSDNGWINLSLGG